MVDATVTRNHFRFSVKSLLGVITVLALILTFAPRLYRWYYAVPPILLADAAEQFGWRVVDDPIGQYEPRLTEKEIIASIRAQLPGLSASDKVKTIYAEIARTGELPPMARLSENNGWTLANGTKYSVWWIDLSVVTERGAFDPKTNQQSFYGYSLRIRETNEPIAKPKSEPKLTKPSFNWIPKPTDS